jgi:hypothetical protein
VGTYDSKLARKMLGAAACMHVMKHLPPDTLLMSVGMAPPIGKQLWQTLGSMLGARWCIPDMPRRC